MKKRSQGFTIIEMMGVLAIISVLAIFLVPKITAAMRDSRATAIAGQLRNILTQIQTYSDKYNRIPVTETANVAPGGAQSTSVGTGITQDDVTLADALHGAGIMDELPVFKFGDNPISSVALGGVVWDPNSRTFATGTGTLSQFSTTRYNRIEAVTCTTGTTPINASGTWTGAFLLDGVNPISTPRTICVAILENIKYTEARELVEKINPQGPAMLDADGAAQQRGRVVFAAPTGNTTTAYVFITD